MDKPVEFWCRQVFESSDKKIAFKSILLWFMNDNQAIHTVWKYKEFPLAILQILTDSFYSLSSGSLSEHESEQVTTCLTILQYMVSIPNCKEFFLETQFDYYVYPFLIMNVNDSVSLAALNLFCSVLEGGIPESMRTSELIPLLLKVVDSNSRELRLLSLKALDLIMQGTGLDYAVQTLDRFQAMDVVLSSLVSKAIFSGDDQLLKCILKIYLRLCKKTKVCQKLREKLPEGIDSKEAMVLCSKDEELSKLHSEFLKLLS